MTSDTYDEGDPRHIPQVIRDLLPSNPVLQALGKTIRPGQLSQALRARGSAATLDTSNVRNVQSYISVYDVLNPNRHGPLPENQWRDDDVGEEMGKITREEGLSLWEIAHSDPLHDAGYFVGGEQLQVSSTKTHRARFESMALKAMLHDHDGRLEQFGWQEAPPLQKVTRPSSHGIVPLYATGRLWSDNPLGFPDTQRYLNRSARFLVQHDWTQVVAELTQGEKIEHKLPYPDTVFEFQFDDRAVAALCHQAESGKIQVELFVSLQGVKSNQLDPAEFSCYDVAHFHYIPSQHDKWDFVWNHIQAILILLDTDVLQKAMPDLDMPAMVLPKAGKRVTSLNPKKGYHVLKLHPRVVRERNDTPTNRRVRLHFRRGHWRHYEKSNIRIWIKHQLVGDPDLGFLAKDYSI